MSTSVCSEYDTIIKFIRFSIIIFNEDNNNHKIRIKLIFSKISNANTNANNCNNKITEILSIFARKSFNLQ